MSRKVTTRQIIAAVEQDDHIGFCVKCGAEHYSIDRGAIELECDECGKFSVYSADEILFSIKCFRAS